MRFLHQLLGRIGDLRARLGRRIARRRQVSIITPLYLSFSTSIHRDVSSNGVYVYSLCGCCGSRLTASATLCDECAAKQSRSAGPR